MFGLSIGSWCIKKLLFLIFGLAIASRQFKKFEESSFFDIVNRIIFWWAFSHLLTYLAFSQTLTDSIFV